MRLFLLLATTATFSLTAFGAGPALDAVATRPDLFSLSADAFSKVDPAVRRFEWTSNAHDSARAAGKEVFTLFGLPVVESVARFDSGKLASITAIFYARGDAGEMPKEQFEALIRKAVDVLGAATKVKPTVRGKDPNSAVRAEGIIWQTPAAKYLLEYSFVKEVKTRDVPYRAEFVRLEITPAEKAASILDTVATSGGRVKFSGPAHVKKDAASGDVYIADVPMVDQGQKGYCVVASTERVMRYYGVKTDENELAQVANSDAGHGTSLTAMNAALKKLSGRLHVRVRPVEEMEVKELLSLIKEYNSAAKRGSRANQIPDPGRMLDAQAIFQAMDRTVLQEVRTKSKADVSRFQREITSHVDAGIPLNWSVMLGIVPEPGVPQSGGGHMRLIIGYNSKKDEVLFTDSWGAGHELKRMSTADAMTITMGMTALEPLN